ncbi:MAG: TatD family hydrolase [Rhodoferax sp.]|nr:TatD family hydrolase [Rhodoferax sp.]
MQWIDSHCHLDAFEFSQDVQQVRGQARRQGVVHCVIPAVAVNNFERVRLLAHAGGDSYCLGIHPLYVPQASEDDLRTLEAQLNQHRHDPRLVAVGEIGLDYFVPALCQSQMREKQEHFYLVQLRLARQFDLPVVLHVRRSADRLLKHLRSLATKSWGGIAHAFNGSVEQASAFVQLGLKLGFGGALTFARAQQLRRLAATLPLEALVLETDAPDIPPHWLYATAAQRQAGQAQGRNTPGELPRIAAEVAQLRSMELAALAHATHQNTLAALPRLAHLIRPEAGQSANPAVINP